MRARRPAGAPRLLALALVALAGCRAGRVPRKDLGVVLGPVVHATPGDLSDWDLVVSEGGPRPELGDVRVRVRFEPPLPADTCLTVCEWPVQRPRGTGESGSARSATAEGSIQFFSFFGSPPVRTSVPAGTTELWLHGWGAWDPVVTVYRGSAPYFQECIEEGERERVLKVPPVVAIGVRVDRGRYPHARKVLAVPGTGHRPDPSRPSGSRIDFLEALDEHAFSANDVDGDGALAGSSLLSFYHEGVLQLWGLDPVRGGWELLAAQPFTASGPSLHAEFR